MSANPLLIIDDLKSVLRYEQNRMGSVSQGLLKRAIDSLFGLLSAGLLDVPVPALTSLKDAVDFMDKCRVDVDAGPTGALLDAEKWIEAAAREVVAGLQARDMEHLATGGAA